MRGNDAPAPPQHLQYHNIFSMIRELGIPWPFTDFETSGFWGADGKLITQVRGGSTPSYHLLFVAMCRACSGP